MGSLLGWGLLLSFALLGPVALPAGGGSIFKEVIRRSEERSPIFAGDSCALRASPSANAPSLRIIQPGTPLRVLRFWQSPEGINWIQIQIVSLDFAEVVGSASRGWVNV